MNIRVPFSVNIMLKIPQRFGYAEVRFFDERVLSGIITEPADGLLELHGWASRSLPLFPGGGYSGFQATGMIEWGQKMFRTELKRRGMNFLCEGSGLLSSKPPEKYDVIFLADLEN